MLHYIESLRQKSEKTRRRYALGISLFIILIIAGTWTINRFYFTNSLSNSRGSENVANKDPSPFQSVFKTFSDGYANVLGAVKNIPIKTNLSNISSTTPSAKPDTPPKLGGEAEKNSTTTAIDKFNTVIITDPAN